MNATESIGCDIVVYAQVRDPEARVRMRRVLEDLPSEHVAGLLYEVTTDTWTAEDWDEEVERMSDLIDPATDTLIFWRALNGKLVRTCIAGRLG